jgi:type II secretory pathway component PulK
VNTRAENAQLVAELRAELLDNGRALAKAFAFAEDELKSSRPIEDAERLFDNVSELRDCNRQMRALISALLQPRGFTPVVIRGGKSR